MNAGLRDIENRIGIGHVDEHAARYLNLSKEAAPLRAKYGPGGTFDAQRKADLSAIRMLLRARYADKDEKVSEARLDEEAHCHRGYVEFIGNATTERARLAELDAELETLQWLVNREQGLIRYTTNEPR